jgi:hypothetical protein
MRRLSDMGRPFSFSSGLVNWELDASGDLLVVLDIIRVWGWRNSCPLFLVQMERKIRWS